MLSIAAHLAILAMKAGYAGEPLPSHGDGGKPEWRELVNAVYEAAKKLREEEQRSDAGL